MQDLAFLNGIAIQITLTVNQLLNHLKPETHGAILVSNESMLEFLRERMMDLNGPSA